MSVAAVITVAKQAGTVKVTGGGAEFPILRMTERASVVGPDGANGGNVTRRTFVIDSMAVCGGEDPAVLSALKVSLKTDLARRGDVVTLTEMGGTARTLRAGGDVGGIGGAGTTTMPGYPAISIEFNAEKSKGAVVFFTLTIETMESTFGAAAGGYNVVHANQSLRISRDAAGNISTTVRGNVTLKPGQNALAYIAEVILEPARDEAVDDEEVFTDSSDRPSLDSAYAQYEYTVSDPQFDATGVGTATVVDENDVTATSIEGRINRTRAGTVTGPGAYAAAQARRLSPVPANHLFVSDSISQPDTIGGAVQYQYAYLTGTQGTGALNTSYFTAWAHEARPVGPPGGRRLNIAEFDNASPKLGYHQIGAASYVEVITFECIGAWPEEDDVPRASGLVLSDQSASPVYERWAGGGLKRGRITRTYTRATPLGTSPVPVGAP